MDAPTLTDLASVIGYWQDDDEHERYVPEYLVIPETDEPDDEPEHDEPEQDDEMDRWAANLWERAYWRD